VGSIAAGKLADLVLWQPAWFGAQPELVLKSGFVAWGNVGSGSGSTRLTQPRRMLPFYGGLGAAPVRLAQVFVSGHARSGDLPRGRNYATISGSRGLGCADMLHNTPLLGWRCSANRSRCGWTDGRSTCTMPPHFR